MIPEVQVGPGDALVVVDVQNDFCPGGALAVPDGDAVVLPLNGFLRRFGRDRLPVVATRDWHPGNHRSFRAQGGPWMPHCVKGTTGASLHPDLEIPCDSMIVSKGTDPASEGYSAFEQTGLADRLRERGVRRLVVGGLATDYCVRATVLDALHAGFAVVVVGDACRGVEVEPGDSARALADMRQAGALVIDAGDLA